MQVLVVPQATLGGRVKGKSLQYHGNIAPQVLLQPWLGTTPRQGRSSTPLS